MASKSDIPRLKEAETQRSQRHNLHGTWAMVRQDGTCNAHSSIYRATYPHQIPSVGPDTLILVDGQTRGEHWFYRRFQGFDEVSIILLKRPRPTTTKQTYDMPGTKHMRKSCVEGRLEEHHANAITSQPFKNMSKHNSCAGNCRHPKLLSRHNLCLCH